MNVFKGLRKIYNFPLYAVNASQGDNAEEIARAQKEVKEAQEAVEKAVEAARQAHLAQVELQGALNEVKRQEEERDNKTKTLTEKSETGGVVSRNKAKAELAQHLAEVRECICFPLPLFYLFFGSFSFSFLCLCLLIL